MSGFLRRTGTAELVEAMAAAPPALAAAFGGAGREIGAALDAAGRDGVRLAGRFLTGIDPVTAGVVPQTERALFLLGGALPPIRAAGRLPAGLLADPEGRVLSARLIAGRQADGSVRGLAPDEVRAVAESLADRVSVVPAAELGDELGAVAYRMPDQPGRGPAGHVRPLEMTLDIADDVDGPLLPRVMAHETGHLMDLTAGASARLGAGEVAGLETLSRRFRPEVWADPWSQPYARDGRELVADGLAAYMTDPAGTRSAAPEAAAFLRRWINQDDRLRPLVALNARPWMPGLLHGGDDGGDDDGR